MYNVFWYLYFLLTTKVRYLRHRFFSCISSLLSFFRLVLSRMDHMNASIILKFSQLVLQSKIVPWRGSFLGYLLTIMFSVFASHVLRQMSLFDLRGRKKVNIKRRYKTACLSRHLKVWLCGQSQCIPWESTILDITERISGPTPVPIQSFFS